MPPANSTDALPAGSAFVGRLLDFAQPVADDVCLDVTYDNASVAAAMRSRVRHVATVDAGPARDLSPTMPRVPADTVPFGVAAMSARGPAGPDAAPHAMRGAVRHRPAGVAPDTLPVRAVVSALPYKDGVFTLVTTQYPVHRLNDPISAVREMLRVCRPDGRLIIAGLVRSSTATAERDRLERLRDPEHRGTPSLSRLTGLLVDAGANVRRLDVFVVERPAEPWLAGCDDASAGAIRAALIAEIDGGPRTGAHPRIIGGELWFTQSWAQIAAVRA